MRTMLSLDEDVFHAARELARTSDMTLGELLSEVARKGLSAAAAAGDRNGSTTARGPAKAKAAAAKRVVKRARRALTRERA